MPLFGVGYVAAYRPINSLLPPPSFFLTLRSTGGWGGRGFVNVGPKRGSKATERGEGVWVWEAGGGGGGGGGRVFPSPTVYREIF